MLASPYFSDYTKLQHKPIRNRLLPTPEFMLPRPPKMLHKLIPEDLPRYTVLPHEPLRRLSQTLCQSYTFIRAPTNILPLPQRRYRNLQLLLDAAPSTRHNRREDEKWIRVCTRNAHLKACCLGASRGWSNQSNGCGAVLVTPGHGDGRPEVLDEALIAVYCRRENRHYVWQALQQTSEEVPSHVGEEAYVGICCIRVLRRARKQVLPVCVDKGNVHVARVAWEALRRLCHERGCDAVSTSNILRHELEERGFISHNADFAVVQCSFEDAGPGFSVPTFDAAIELFAGVVDVVVPILISNRVCEAVAEHAFGEMGKRGGRLGVEEAHCGGGVAVVGVLVSGLGDAVLVEFVLGCEMCLSD